MWTSVSPWAKDGSVKGTLIAKEYSTSDGEPYYPVPNPENRALYEKYAALAAKEVGLVTYTASTAYFASAHRFVLRIRSEGLPRHPPHRVRWIVYRCSPPPSTA